MFWVLCSDRWKWDIKLLQVNKTMGRGNAPEQWMVLVALCSDCRSVCVGHRACVGNSGCGVIPVTSLCVCWSCSEGGLRCAGVGFYQVYCPGWPPGDGTHSPYNHEEFSDPFLLGLWLTAQ